MGVQTKGTASMSKGTEGQKSRVFGGHREAVPLPHA